MDAIFAAFDRHEIACDVPVVQSNGCAGGPTEAPAVTATPIDKGAVISMSEVAGASSYSIFRADGLKGCDIGKVKVGEVTADVGLGESPEFVDSGLRNGREYYYTVLPVGPSASCLGPASPCTTVTPVSGPNLNLDLRSISTSFNTGDADRFIDNCEEADLGFSIENVGQGSQQNVRILGVTPVSHPTTLITNGFPVVVATNLGACQEAQGSFSFQARDMAFDETITFDVEYTSDNLLP